MAKKYSKKIVMSRELGVLFLIPHSSLLTLNFSLSTQHSALNSTVIHLRHNRRLDSTLLGNVNQPLLHIRG